MSETQKQPLKTLKKYITQQREKEAGHVSLRQRCKLSFTSNSQVPERIRTRSWYYVENELASWEDMPPLMQYGCAHIPRSFNATATKAHYNKCCLICSIDDAKLLILNLTLIWFIFRCGLIKLIFDHGFSLSESWKAIPWQGESVNNAKTAFTCSSSWRKRWHI